MKKKILINRFYFFNLNNEKNDGDYSNDDI